MFRPILFLAIIRLDTIIGENYTILCDNSITISVGVNRGGRDLFTKELEGFCAEGLICRYIHFHVTSMIS